MITLEKDYLVELLLLYTLLLKNKLISNENTIIGNTVLYGATSGKLFASGQAGETICS